MSCLQTLTGIARDCATSMGGVRKVWITNHAAVTAKTVTNDVITAVTLSTGETWHAFEFRSETASLEKSWQVNKENGTVYVHSTLTMLFHRMTTAKRIELNALAMGELAAIVLDNNGTYWYLGYDNPVTIDSGDSGTGTAMSDANRYGIVLGDDSILLPYEVNGSVVE